MPECRLWRAAKPGPRRWCSTANGLHNPVTPGTQEDPGDVTQAVRIYERMKRSYEILMDPTLRKAHDERMTANVRTAGGESPPEHGV